MTYRFELESEFTTVPFIDGSGTAVIEFALGYDIDESKVIVMSVMLVNGDSYLGGTLTGIYDLQFGIRERIVSSNTISALDFGSESASRYIPKPARTDVTRALLEAIHALVDWIKPLHLTMETFYGNLPAKALEKYGRISSLLEKAGYRIHDRFRDDQTGIDYWYFLSPDIEKPGQNR